jgi:fused signal recognition particle receptor
MSKDTVPKRSLWGHLFRQPPTGNLPDEGSSLETAHAESESGPRLAPLEPPNSVSQEAAPRSWWRRLQGGLARSSTGLSTSLSDLFNKRKLDAQTLEDFEDALLRADLGVDSAARITTTIGSGRYGRDLDAAAVKGILVDEIEKLLTPVARPLIVDPSKKPFVILMVGVNGSGKTTTIGKLGAKLAAQGRSVMLAAGDTFRAAAIEQLQLWGKRIGAPVIAREQGADAAGVAFEALMAARGEGVDILLLDTAGRLQNRAELMGELEKIVRVIKKIDDTAPHAVLLVLDATVGQNALSQVEIFARTAGVTGLVMTKLDGTARGGILVAIAAKFALPINLIGVGEGIEDLEPFAARDFAKALVGVE